ncbi:hypothetical protein R5R35_006099 [Gryllus longicercus]|uniref:Uncharacterized protein n=1 Tax=Gryllus longicercus TaxID=2509291 RepID=A0AAN9ZER5_9ORTH
MPLPYGYLVNESAGRKRLVSVFPWTECYEDDSSSTESSANDSRANRARVNLYSQRLARHKPASNDSAENQHIVDILPWPTSKANDLSWIGFGNNRSPWTVKFENGSRVVRSKVEGSPWKSSSVNEASWSVRNNYSGSRSRQLSEIRTTSSENTGSGNGVSGSSEGSSGHWSRENESIWSISSINGNEINVSRFSAIGRNDSRATRLGVKLPGFYELGRNESRANGSQVNGSGVNESSRIESAANGSRGTESSRAPPRPRRWKRRAPRSAVGGGAEPPGEGVPPMRGWTRAAWRAGCGRRAGAIVGLLLALAGAAPALAQALEQAGALRALREGAGLPGAPTPVRGGAALRAAHWALAAARALELPLLLLALAGALAGRRRLVAPWLGWAPVSVAAGAAQTVLALVQLLRLAAREGLPLQGLLAARMGLYAAGSVLASLASVMLVEGFRRGPPGSAYRAAAAREQRRSFELPPLHAPPAQLPVNGHSHA